MPLLRILMLSCVLLATSALSVQQSAQPTGERKAQDTLPKSNDPIWADLAKCKLKLDPDKWLYKITLTPEVKAMDGKQESVSGFMLPLEPKEKFQHFLLSKRTPTCPFCPPGEPNEIIEVFSKEPMTWEDGIVVMNGKFILIDNPDMGGLFFQMKDATESQAAHFEAKPARAD